MELFTLEKRIYKLMRHNKTNLGLPAQFRPPSMHGVFRRGLRVQPPPK